jgi:hypothetical protein
MQNESGLTNNNIHKMSRNAILRNIKTKSNIERNKLEKSIKLNIQYNLNNQITKINQKYKDKTNDLTNQYEILLSRVFNKHQYSILYQKYQLKIINLKQKYDTSLELTIELYNNIQNIYNKIINLNFSEEYYFENICNDLLNFSKSNFIIINLAFRDKFKTDVYSILTNKASNKESKNNAFYNLLHMIYISHNFENNDSIKNNNLISKIVVYRHLFLLIQFIFAGSYAEIRHVLYGSKSIAALKKYLKNLCLSYLKNKNKNTAMYNLIYDIGIEIDDYDFKFQVNQSFNKNRSISRSAGRVVGIFEHFVGFAGDIVMDLSYATNTLSGHRLLSEQPTLTELTTMSNTIQSYIIILNDYQNLNYLDIVELYEISKLYSTLHIFKNKFNQEYYHAYQSYKKHSNPNYITFLLPKWNSSKARF